jgi:NADH-quinone oxidoreductase subunit N
MAVLLMIVGFAFKISAVPFHFWAPDTYEGAPTPITAYLSVNSKAAGFVAMLLVMYLALPDVAEVWAPALWLLAALSMTIANLSALCLSPPPASQAPIFRKPSRRLSSIS